MQASERGNSYYSSFLKCRRYFNWQHVQGLEPKFKGPALLIGGAVHEGLRAYYRDASNRPLEDRVLSCIAAAVKEVEAYKGSEEVKEETINILDQYLDKYKNDDLEMIRSEMEGELLVNGVLFTYRMDGLVRKNGLLWVKEVKTTS